jgi:hypothetical protein
MNDTAREPNHYEYRFKTTPQYVVIEEEVVKGVALPQWELHDVFLKYLDNGAFVFVPVFRRRITNPTNPS